jgi:hypothetical protein
MDLDQREMFHDTEIPIDGSNDELDGAERRRLRLTFGN